MTNQHKIGYSVKISWDTTEQSICIIWSCCSDVTDQGTINHRLLKVCPPTPILEKNGRRCLGLPYLLKHCDAHLPAYRLDCVDFVPRAAAPWVSELSPGVVELLPWYCRAIAVSFFWLNTAGMRTYNRELLTQQNGSTLSGRGSLSLWTLRRVVYPQTMLGGSTQLFGAPSQQNRHLRQDTTHSVSVTRGSNCPDQPLPATSSRPRPAHTTTGRGSRGAARGGPAGIGYYQVPINVQV